MTVFLLVSTVVALVLSNASLLVALLVRLAEEHRDIADQRRSQEIQQCHDRQTSTR